MYFMLCNFHTLHAQFTNNIWCFGDSAGINFSNLITPTAINTSLVTRGSCASISDTSGDLLFYAQTSYKPLYTQGYVKLTAVWNKENGLLKNGDSIVGRGWYKE